MEQTKKELLAKLRQANVARVTIEYDGAGDEGTVRAPAFFDEPGEEVSPDVSDSTTGLADYDALDSEIQEFVHAQLDRHAPGWEISEGSEGSVEIDVQAETVTIAHSEYRLVECGSFEV